MKTQTGKHIDLKIEAKTNTVAETQTKTHIHIDRYNDRNTDKIYRHNDGYIVRNIDKNTGRMTDTLADTQTKAQTQ